MGKLRWLDDAVKGAARNLDDAAHVAAKQADVISEVALRRSLAQAKVDSAARYSRLSDAITSRDGYVYRIVTGEDYDNALESGVLRPGRSADTGGTVNFSKKPIPIYGGSAVERHGMVVEVPESALNNVEKFPGSDDLYLQSWDEVPLGAASRMWGIQFNDGAIKVSDIGEEITGRAANQLDMSTAARMQRAAEQGNTRRVYHATTNDIDAFNPDMSSSAAAFGPGVYVSDDPLDAGRWAKSSDGANVMPLLANDSNVLRMRPLSAGDAKKLSAYLGREIKVGDPPPLLSLEKRGGSVSQGAAAAGFSGVEHAGPTGKTHIVFSDPADVRSVHAAFDPANIGKNDLLGAATIGGMATAGALGAGLMGAQAYDFGTPDYDAKIQEFRNRRAAKSQIWKELKEAGATIASAIPAGIISDAYRIGGYLSPVTPVEETERGAEIVQNALMYTPEGDNRYLNEFARQVNQFGQDVEPLVNAWKQTPIYRGYKQLPQRIQGLIRTASDYAF